MTDAAVDALAKDLLDWYVEWDPRFATFVGIHDCDHLLPKGTYEAQLKERRQLKAFLRRLERIERGSLSPGKKIDHGVLRNSLRLFLFQDEGLGIWRSFPDGAEAAANSLFPLFLREV